MFESLTFSKNLRLRDSKEFQKVFDAQQRMKSGIGVFHCAENTLANARLGMIVSKRNVRLSVKRNLIKRITREHFRLHHQALSGYDIVFVAYHEAATASNEELHKCINDLFQRLLRRSERLVS